MKMKKYFILSIIYAPICYPSQSEQHQPQIAIEEFAKELTSQLTVLYGNQEKEAPTTLLQLTEKTLNQTRDSLKDLQERLPKKRQELLQRPYKQKQWDLWRVNYTIAEINLNRQLLTMQQYGTDTAERFNLKNKDIVVTTEKCVDHDKILACLNEETLLIQERKRLIEQQSNFYNQVEQELIKAQSSLQKWSKIDALGSCALSVAGTYESARLFNIHRIFQNPRYTDKIEVIASVALATKIAGTIAEKYTEHTTARRLSRLSQETAS
jgi:hypothetical protein